MKEGWKYVSLGECCDVLNGLWKGKKEPFVHVGVIRNANFTKEFTLDFSNVEYLDVEERQYAKRKLKKGDLIVEKSGGSEKWPVGRAVLFLKDDGEFSFSNFTSVLRIKDDIDITPEYLFNYLFFVYMRGDTRNMQKATTGIHNIEFDKYLSIQIPLSPLPEQQRIVEYLDSTFAEINALKAKAAEEVANAKAMFDAALREEMTPKEGWEEKTLGEVAQYRRGSFPQPYGNPEWYDGENAMPFVQVADLQEDSFDLLSNTKKKISEVAQPFSVFVPKGTVLVSLQGSIGKVSITQYDSYVDRTVAIFKSFTEQMDKEFFAYQLKLRFAIEREKARGTTIKTITKEEFSSFAINLPTFEVQKNVVSMIHTLRTLVTSLEQKYSKIAAECDALKQAILRETFE